MALATARGRPSLLAHPQWTAALTSAFTPAPATGVELLLFDREDALPRHLIRLDPVDNRTKLLASVRARHQPGQLYGYRHDVALPRIRRAAPHGRLFAE